MMAGRMISGAAALAELVRPAGETDEPGVHRVLPVAPELRGLLPGHGLRRGSTVAVAAGPAVRAGGSTSLLLALLGEASRTGAWCAVVGVPSLGALAAAESGIDLERFALVPHPGPDWPTVVAALIDGVDLVVVAMPGPVAAAITSRLVARARQRGSVLVPYGQWDGADLTLRVTHGCWEGLGFGHGRLRRRTVTILARGRGAATRPREITMWMPGFTVVPFVLPALPPVAPTDIPLASSDHVSAGSAEYVPAWPDERVPAADAAVVQLSGPLAEHPAAAAPHDATAGDGVETLGQVLPFPGKGSRASEAERAHRPDRIGGAGRTRRGDRAEGEGGRE